MPSTPHIIGITATKADGSVYSGRVWLMNVTNQETMYLEADGNGQVVFDLANFNRDYANGDTLVWAIEAYGDPGFVLTRQPFEDSTVESIEIGDERLNTATATVNIKVK